jgi:hypothetical protein
MRLIKTIRRSGIDQDVNDRRRPPALFSKTDDHCPSLKGGRKA